MLPAVPLDHFALPSAHQVAGILVDYQVAQKVHACTDPHDPPSNRNDRPRDVIDLLLLREEHYPPGTHLSALRTACIDIFTARAALSLYGRRCGQGVAANRRRRTHTGPRTSGAKPGSAGFTRPLDDAVADLNAWIAQIATTADR